MLSHTCYRRFWQSYVLVKQDNSTSPATKRQLNNIQIYPHGGGRLKLGMLQGENDYTKRTANHRARIREMYKFNQHHLLRWTIKKQI